MQKTYFPGLNTVRFYAALSVVVHHFTAPNTWFGDSSALAYRIGSGFLEGGNAVTLFFVLSGFLIIYLLIKEREQTGTIRVRRFYVRRAFRILPLYYATLAAGAALFVLTWPVLPVVAQAAAANPAIWITALLYCLNLLGIVVSPISHLWSLNVEEQFYAFCPLLIKRAGSIPRTLIGFIALKLAFQAVCLMAFQLTRNPLLQYVYEMGVIMRFECMALGGLAAWLVYHDHALLRLLCRPLAQAITMIGCGGILIFGGVNDLAFNSASSIVYALLIVNIVSAPRFLLRIETPLLRRLGDLSYAIYMVHQLVIWGLWVWGVRGIAYPVLSVTLSVALAHLIHVGMERPFLRWRDRLTLRTPTATKSV